MWSVVTGEAEHVIKGHEEDVRGCSISSDARRVATCSFDRLIRVWGFGCRASERWCRARDLLPSSCDGSKGPARLRLIRATAGSGAYRFHIVYRQVF